MRTRLLFTATVHGYHTMTEGPRNVIRAKHNEPCLIFNTPMNGESLFVHWVVTGKAEAAAGSTGFRRVSSRGGGNSRTQAKATMCSTMCST